MKNADSKKNPAAAAFSTCQIPSAGHGYTSKRGRGLLLFAVESGCFLVMNSAIERKPVPGWRNTMTVGLAQYENKIFDVFYAGLLALTVVRIWEVSNDSEETRKSNTDLYQTLQKKLSDNNIDIRLYGGLAGHFKLVLKIGL